MSDLLVAEDVHVSYGKLHVLQGVTIRVGHGDAVALLGTNGAGKSTLLKAVSGVLPMRGRVLLDGDDVTGSSPQSLLARGVLHVPGGHCTFPRLTVAEALRVATWPFRRDAARVRDALGRIHDRFPILADRADQPCGSLSGGEQQMLALSRALASPPRLLIVDELSLGLAPVVIEGLVSVVRELHEQGTALLVVEQRLATAMRITDRAYFLERGGVQFEGPTSELADRDDLVRAVFLTGATS